MAHWGGMVGWAASVGDLRTFARQRPGYVRQHTAEAFGVASAPRLALRRLNDGSGSVAVNGALLSGLPWDGDHFQGTRVQIVSQLASRAQVARVAEGGVRSFIEVSALRQSKGQRGHPEREPPGSP
jgi:hypothetical protein